MRRAIGSFLIPAAMLATACGTQSPASPSAVILHGGDSHRGGSNGTGSDNGTSNASHDTEINGLVTAVGSDSLTVGTQKIVVTAATTIDSDGRTLALADIKVGNRVEVKATMSGTTATAIRIHVERGDDDEGADDHGGSNS